MNELNCDKCAKIPAFALKYVNNRKNIVHAPNCTHLRKSTNLLVFEIVKNDLLLFKAFASLWTGIEGMEFPMI